MVPLPNLCVELRGYDNDAVAVEDLSESAPGANTGTATASTAGGHAWPNWGGIEPRFRQLQRTGKSDGSFVFVTPETGVTFVLAAYSNRGDYPDVIRTFPDGPSSGGDETVSCQEEAIARGEATPSAFGVESGRLLMHIDFAGGEGIHAPEVLWSAASRENDQSPCARTEASSSSSSSTGPLPTPHVNSQHADGGGRSGTQQSDPPATTRDLHASTHHVSRWTFFLEVLRRVYGDSSSGGNADQARAAVKDVLQSLWEAKRAVYDLWRSGLEAAERRVHESTLVSPVWLSVKELPNLFVRGSTKLSNWVEPTSRELLAWFLEVSTRLLSWLEVQSPVNVREWWTVWWVKVASIAVILGTMQQMFVVMCKLCCRSSRELEVESDEGGAIVDDHRCSESLRQEPAKTTDSMVGTFYGSDGRVSQLQLAKFCRPEEPATAKRRRGGGGIFGAMWGRNESKLAVGDDVSNGRNEEQGDEFSSMFRALNESSSELMNANEGNGVSGASSGFVVTQQQSWS